MMWWKRAQLEPQLYNTTLCDAAIGCETNSDKNFGVGPYQESTSYCTISSSRFKGIGGKNRWTC